MTISQEIAALTAQCSRIAEAILDSNQSLIAIKNAISALDYNRAMNSVASAIANIQIPAHPIQPEPIYDCETGEVSWIDMSTGNTTTVYPGITYNQGSIYNITNNTWNGTGITMPDPCDDPAPTFTDSDPVYGSYNPDDPQNPFSDTEQPIDEEKCKKIRHFLYDVYERLETFTTLHTVAEISLSLYVGWLARLYPRWYVTGGGLVEFPINNKYIANIAGWLITISSVLLDTGDFTTGFTDDFKQDALCALYNAPSGSTAKTAWDDVISNHFNWWAPQAIIMRILGHDSFMNAICNPDMTAHADAPMFAMSCSGCDTPGNTLTSVLGLYLGGGGGTLTTQIIEFPNPYIGATPDNGIVGVRWTLQQDTTTPLLSRINLYGYKYRITEMSDQNVTEIELQSQVGGRGRAADIWYNFPTYPIMLLAGSGGGVSGASSFTIEIEVV
jgi:hypothetical protein